MSYFDKEKNPYNIDKEAHYFAQIAPFSAAGLMFGIGIKTSGEETWVEAAINEDRYKVDDGYKVTLKAINPIYGSESYYQSDFISLLNAGIILKKTSKKAHIEHIAWIEPLCGNVFLYNEADIVAED